MGLQICESPNFRNFRTPNLGVPRQNDILVHARWPCTKNTIKGKVVFPPSLGCCEYCESVFACGSFVHQKCSNYALSDLLFCLCMSMWIIESLVTRLSPHLEALACPFTLKMMRAMECTPTPYPLVIFTLARGWVYQGAWGCINNNNI
jgi:hypothetical protein